MEDTKMAQNVTKLPVKTVAQGRWPAGLRPLESLQREIDRLFEDFGQWRFPFTRALAGFEPMWQAGMSWGAVPAVDVVESDKTYEITAELPGIDEKNVELTVSGGMLSIKGEKSEEKEDKQKGYYLSERQYGSFQRSFALPEDVEADKIDASFKNGVLTVSLPKKAEAVKPEKKISIKAA
jgi:HSP20 family protein